MSVPLLVSLERLVEPALGSAFGACAMSVWHRGEERLRKAWGTAEGRAAREDDLYDLASVTKLFTTTLALRLAARGRLGLDDAAASWVPAFAQRMPREVDAGCDPHSLAPIAPDARWAGQAIDPHGIDLRHLLTHTSGLHAWLPLFLSLGPAPGEPVAGQDLRLESRQEKALALVCAAGFAHPPGVKPLYSDLGFILLGEVLARAAGLPLQQAIAEQVVRPLGLGRCDFNPVVQGWATTDQTLPTELDLRWRGRRVRGQVHDENACAMGGVAGHAGLFACVSEVAAFGQAWLEGGACWGLPTALAGEALREHHSHATRRRGLGFMLKATEGASCGDRFSAASFGHTGYTGTSLWIDPGAELVVAFLSNAVHGGRDMSALQPLRRALHDRLHEALAE